MSKELFQTDSSSLVKNKHKTLNIGVVGPSESGKSEFIKYLIKDNECKGFEIIGNCYVSGLRVFYNESETVILNVTEFRGAREKQLKEAEKWNLDVYFLFYDVVNEASFKEAKNLWVVKLYDRIQPTIVMGNKADKPEEKKVKTKMPDVSQEGWESGHIEISSITGTNVNPFIKRTIEIMLGIDVEIQQDLNLPQSMRNLQLAELPRDADTFYDMSGNGKGICLILSVRSFDNVEEKERKGTEKDEKRISKLFRHLGFDVQLHTDLSGFDIQLKLKQVADLDHSQSKCFVLFVMSHGKEGCILGADHAPVLVENIIRPFMTLNCKTLEGKPKLFFIQACQGEQHMQSRAKFQTDSALAVGVTTSVSPLSFSYARGYSTIPDAADILLAVSTVNGYVSFRSPDEGSVFISVLVEEIEKSPAASVADILTRVNCIIGEMEFNKGNKQMTCFRSTLMKKIVLKPTS